MTPLWDLTSPVHACSTILMSVWTVFAWMTRTCSFYTTANLLLLRLQLLFLLLKSLHTRPISIPYPYLDWSPRRLPAPAYTYLSSFFHFLPSSLFYFLHLVCLVLSLSKNKKRVYTACIHIQVDKTLYAVHKCLRRVICTCVHPEKQIIIPVQNTRKQTECERTLALTYVC